MMMDSYCEENWDEDEPPSSVSGEWKGYSDWDYDAKKAEFDPCNTRCDGWRNEIEDSPRKPQNSYTKQNEHNSSNTRRGNNFRQDRLAGNIWRGSREFTSSSRYSNSSDSKSGFLVRKPVDDLPNDFLRLTINSSDVGKVIGKGGSKIRELQDESGARINIVPSDNQPETLVELRGLKEHQKKAKELIENFLSNFSNRQRSNEYRNWNSSDNSNWSNQTYCSNDSEDASEPVDWGALIRASEKNKAERLAALPPIKKQFYFEDPEVSNISDRDANAFRIKNNNITVSKLNKDDDRKIPNPVCNFQQAFKHYPDILDEIEKQGFTNPSPIQCQAWPILLQGYDMIGIAQTGTGKTIAFLLPAMIHIDNQEVPREDRSGPTCLILAPTRELAQQIEQETKKYKYRGIKCVCLYGGGSRREQINIVTKGVEIVIATPGRLNDLVMNKIIDVSSVTYLVLDEADRMLDMGFEPQIKKILIDIRPDRQTVMTSATWPEGVRRLADRYMDKPYQVCIGTLDLTAVHSVTQRILLVSDEEKRDVLFDFLYNMGPEDKVIVFVDRKSVCDDLSSDLVLSGIDCQSLHGDREQCDREQALDDLKTGLVRILVATDVASRGLDIKDITHIFNFSFPRNIEEYVHRVGRTGRAGRTGESVTLVTRGDWKQARELIKILKEADQEVPNELITMAERYEIWKQKKVTEDAACGGRRFKSGRSGGRRY